MLSPEDSPSWKDVASDTTTPVVLVCRNCSETISLWHCADSGCPWCALCGTNTKEEKP